MTISFNCPFRWSRDTMLPAKAGSGMLKIALSAFALVFLAELGDKTQLAVLALATESRTPWAYSSGREALLFSPRPSLLGWRVYCTKWFLQVSRKGSTIPPVPCSSLRDCGQSLEPDSHSSPNQRSFSHFRNFSTREASVISSWIGVIEMKPFAIAQMSVPSSSGGMLVNGSPLSQ